MAWWCRFVLLDRKVDSGGASKGGNQLCTQEGSYMVKSAPLQAPLNMWDDAQGPRLMEALIYFHWAQEDKGTGSCWLNSQLLTPGSSSALGAAALGPDALPHQDVVWSGAYNVLTLSRLCVVVSRSEEFHGTRSSGLRSEFFWGLVWGLINVRVWFGSEMI